MISITSSGIVTSIVSYAVLTIHSVTAAAENQKTCNSEVCKIVAKIYDDTLSRTVSPCTDFFTYVCSGWFQKVENKSSLKSELVFAGTDESLSEATTHILLKQLERVRNEAGKAPVGKFRKSEVQAAMFFKSCLRSRRKPNWDRNLETLRRFFEEVGLPFFGQPADTRNTPFSVMMKLALQFDIKPLFKTTVQEKQVWLRKTRGGYKHRRFGIPLEAVVGEWRRSLNRFSRNTTNDAKILINFGPILETLAVRFRKQELITWGRNFYAVDDCRKRVFEQFADYENVSFGTYSDVLNSTYFDLFNPHMGNLANLQKKHFLSVATQFFEVLVIVTTDVDFAEMFYDYIRLYLVGTEFIQHIGRTGCAIRKGCKVSAEVTDLKYCAELVGMSSPWEKSDTNDFWTIH